MSLTAFLAQNAVKVENVKYVASKRFIDEDGNSAQWEIKCISSTEDESLRKSCIRSIPVPGTHNQRFQRETDMNAYLSKLAVTCTVYPNLNAQDLQDSYGVMGAENMLKTMLTPGEYADYVAKVQEVNGYETLQEEVDEAKN